jgi:K+-transporting ATPase ATPase C chain
MLKHLYPAAAATIFFALLTGIVFPVLVTALASLFFADQSRGSFVTSEDGKIVGSRLIAQEFKSPRYFHSRPSAAGAGYNATASGGTNLGPTSDKLINGTKDHSFVGIKELAQNYRSENNLAQGEKLPVDAVTRSASGLDGDISIANALLQSDRIAKARQLSAEVVRDLILKRREHRLLGFIGEPRLNVLMANLALDKLSHESPAKEKSP